MSAERAGRDVEAGSNADRPGRRIALSVGVGLLTGIATQLGQSLLPEGIGQVANAISPWLFVAFLLGSRMPTAAWSGLAGVVALALALVGYYAMTQLRYGIGGGTSSLVLWSGAALVGGVVFGVLGRWWLDERPWRRAAAVGLMAAAVIAEGVYLTRILPEATVGLGFIVVGAIVPLVLARSWPDRGRAYVAVLPGLVLGAIGYVALLGAATLTTRL